MSQTLWLLNTITVAVAQEDYERRKHVKESEKRQMKEKRKTELELGKVQETKQSEGQEKNHRKRRDRTYHP